MIDIPTVVNCLINDIQYFVLILTLLWLIRNEQGKDMLDWLALKAAGMTV